jgi:prevent-host-death family protein
MKAVAAREAKNRFGQLMDDAQREPVLIEKNGRPVAVVQSYEDYRRTEALKRQALKQGIADAKGEVAAGRIRPFDADAVERIKARGRKRLAKTRHD